MANHVNVAREVAPPVGSAANNPRNAYYIDLGNGAFAEVEAAYGYVYQGGVWVAWDGSVKQGTSPWSVSQASSTPVLKNGLSNSASAVVSSAAAVLTSYYCFNPNGSTAYVQIFDVATAGGVTLGSTTPKWSIAIPAGSAANLAGIHLAFSNGIQVAATTTATGSTAPSTALDCNFGYR